MEIFKDIDELKELTDKLMLRTLELVEEDVTLKINIEKLTNEGALLMAKTRYAHGPKSVSTSQLPAESDEGRVFSALKTTARTENETGVDDFELETHPINKESDHVDPMNWFGILVPQSLKAARDCYDKSIELAVEAVNVEQKIKKNCELLEKLKIIRTDFENTEE